VRIEGALGSYDVEARPFASGGNADLFLCSQPPHLIYKRYKRAVDDSHRRDQILKVRQLGREVLVHGKEEPGSTPEASINWPIDSIHNANGAILGVILPKIPDSFLTSRNVPRSLDFLLLARADPPPPDARVRVSVLLRVAEIFAWLNSHRLIHGDFSSKNIVWRSDPQPGAYLIDCDWLHPQQPRPTFGTVTPGWIDPRLVASRIKAHDHYSDWYALALAMYRGLFLNPGWLERLPDGTWPKPTGIPSGLDPQVRTLLEQTLGNPLHVRPRAKPSQWVTALLTAFVTTSGFKGAALTALDSHASQFRSRYGISAPPRTAKTTPSVARPAAPKSATRPTAPATPKPVPPVVPIPAPQTAPARTASPPVARSKRWLRRGVGSLYPHPTGPMRLRDAMWQTFVGFFIGWFAMWPLMLIVWLLSFGQASFAAVVFTAFGVSEALALTRPWVLMAWSHGWF